MCRICLRRSIEVAHSLFDLSTCLAYLCLLAVRTESYGFAAPRDIEWQKWSKVPVRCAIHSKKLLSRRLKNFWWLCLRSITRSNGVSEGSSDHFPILSRQGGVAFLSMQTKTIVKPS